MRFSLLGFQAENQGANAQLSLFDVSSYQSGNVLKMPIVRYFSIAENAIQGPFGLESPTDAFHPVLHGAVSKRYVVIAARRPNVDGHDICPRSELLMVLALRR